MSTREKKPSRPRPGPFFCDRLAEPDPATRAAKLAAMLDQIEQITDETDTDEVWAEVFRGIDASRPHRPVFRGMY
ncbi:MAG TPA: hypothetical protein VG406_23005 [Isosphaeraceae bacterium]|nr:hypothetical protein [Isosphaeraceae bacterium]